MVNVFPKGTQGIYFNKYRQCQMICQCVHVNEFSMTSFMVYLTALTLNSKAIKRPMKK